MALQLPNWERMSFAEANPLLTGMQAGQQLAKAPFDIQSMLIANQLNQLQAQKAQKLMPFVEPMAQQELQKAQLENKYYAPNIQSEIGLRNAQAGLAGQQSKYYGANIQSEMDLRKAQTQEANALAGKYGIEAQQQALFNKILQNRFQPGQKSSATGGIEGSSVTQTGAQVGGQAAAPVSTTYGIQNPELTNDDIINQKVFGIDTYNSKQQKFKEQVLDQYKEFNKGMTESIKAADAAMGMQQAMNVFNNAMNRSTYKGATLGEIPSSGWKTALIPGDLSPEQEADRAANQMLPEAIATLRNAMGTARFSNLDMNMSRTLKFDRTLNDQTRSTMTSWITAVNDRMKEKARFESVMNNPNSGVTKQEADMLWQDYQNNFPLINSAGDTVQRSNLGNWPLYTTPKAIDSLKRTGSYTPSGREKGTFMMKLPNGEMVPIKKGKVEAAIKKGATLP